MSTATKEIRAYLAEIGRRGGERSRRSLTPQAAKNMVRVREARRAFHKFYAQCFWYMPEDYQITEEDVSEIVRGLRENGGRQGFLLAAKLCR